MTEITFNCDYCPCLMKSLDRWNVILVGSYELIDKKRPCGRTEILGDLVLLRNGQQVAQERNDNGGVFDFFVLDRKSTDQEEDDRMSIYTAHANGAFSIYDLTRTDEDGFVFKQTFNIQTESNMFTSIYTHRQANQSNDVLTLLGDDVGRVYVFCNERQVACFSFLSLDQPCWCLHYEPINTSTTSSSTASTCLSSTLGYILMGSDDSKLRIVPIDCDYQPHVEQTKLISVFEAGVTCICRVRACNEDKCFTFLIGSYDEHVYEFSATLSEKEDDEDGEQMKNIKRQSLDFQLRQKVHVKGAGVWKINQIADNKSVFLLSSMYAGSHFLIEGDSSACYRLIAIPFPCNNKPNTDRLVYACAVDRLNDRFWFASFYDRLVQEISLSGQLLELVHL